MSQRRRGRGSSAHSAHLHHCASTTMSVLVAARVHVFMCIYAFAYIVCAVRL